MTRQTIFVDTETSGLDNKAIVFEVCALFPDEVLTIYAPSLLFEAGLENGHPKALEINNMWERYNKKEVVPGQRDEWEKLNEKLKDVTLAGANVRFDAEKLNYMFRLMSLPTEPWHHRLLDVESFAMGALGLSEVPGLSWLIELYKDDLILPTDLKRHTAEYDAMMAQQIYDNILHIGIR
jgi:DNA polymerase-3 subunit epsilon